ncbi:MAG: N-acetylneuraminate synthase family protein [Candidatus Omnitrophota bacterium]|nr:N-acetylneuraminate synthase family protein [Candidatus Omnitrophota bacterium]
MSFPFLFEDTKNKPAYIIAEIGGNFTAYAEAKKLVDAAKEAGVDCIKLQTYRAETLTTKKAMFDMENTGKISQYEFFKKNELPKELHRLVFDYAQNKGLDWFSTPAHQTDVDMLEALGVKAFKIGADDAVNIPLLKYIGEKDLPVFLSTGMCTLEEVKASVSAILETGNNKIVIFHTVSGYPTYPEYVNLNVIKTLQREFPGFPIGFSDHTLSALASICAVAMGAKVIEKHFTLDKNAAGPDHMLSADPKEMKYLVESIRTVEKMLGSGVKAPDGPEIKNIINNRKSIVATRDIKKGEILSSDNISIKRPGGGIQPKFFEEVIGRKAGRDINEDTLISWEEIG